MESCVSSKFVSFFMSCLHVGYFAVSCRKGKWPVRSSNFEPDPNSSDMLLRNVAKTLTGYKLEQDYRETLQNAFLMNGYFVELVSYENMIWPRTKQYRADFAIRTNALLEEGIDTWLFEALTF